MRQQSITSVSSATQKTNTQVMRLLLLCFILCVVDATNSTQKQPVYTSESGFIKIDPNGGWQIAADGFATRQYGGLYGFAVNSNDATAIMYGDFALWNNSWVGYLLKVNPATMQQSKYNSGVIGSVISSATFYQNDTRIAFIGNFYSFQNNPNTELHHVAACTSDGENCFPLGGGLSNFGTPGDAGIIKTVGNHLYVLYGDAGDHAVIASFNLSSTDSDQQWTIIYSSNMTSESQVMLEVYQDSLWMVGCVWVNQKESVSAARWNSAENSWEFHNNTSNFCNWGGTYYQDAVTTVSPDGQSLYLSFGYPTTSRKYFIWNDSIEDWNVFYVGNCSSVIAARQNGLLIGCKTSVVYIQDGVLKLPNLNCSGFWKNLIVNSQDTRVYAFCEFNGIQSVSYNLSQYSISATNNMTGFEQLLASLDGFCVYGQKIFVSGNFGAVGNTPAEFLALWDNQYKKWYRFQNESYFSKCRCDADGNQLAAVCGYSPPVLMLDWANSDTGSLSYPQNIQLISLVNATDLYETLQVVLASGTVYIGGLDRDIQIVLYKWTSEEGSTLLTTFVGIRMHFYIEDNIAFMVGDFYRGTNTSTEMITAARYNITDNSWLPMDQLLSSLKTDGLGLMIVPWNFTGMVYACGEFAWVGSMKVSNWAGYNKTGQGADAVQPGRTTRVSDLVPLGDLMYLTDQASDCVVSLSSTCKSLYYYDGAKYSPRLTTGVGNIAAGPVQTPAPDNSSSDSTTEYGTIVIPIICVLFLVFIALGAVFFYRRIKKKNAYEYQEIPDVEHKPSEAIGPIDFQHEEFSMKSVLGRGAFGTVWSCVFPHREAATYAVKQMLFSKGETKGIETVQHEIDILEKLRHPYLVHYCGHRVETSNTSVEFFIFMELYEQPCSVKGVIQKRLKQAQKSGKNQWFTYKEIKKYLYQMADALNYLHTQGVAHRDLKCANLLIRAKGNTVNSIHIADFGIARIMNSENGASPLASTVLGTPLFMAPVWSFGMTLYEMLSWEDPQAPGKKPTFPENAMEYMKANDQFASVLEILDRCLQQEPMARPDAAELLNLCENLP